MAQKFILISLHSAILDEKDERNSRLAKSNKRLDVSFGVAPEEKCENLVSLSKQNQQVLLEK